MIEEKEIPNPFLKGKYIIKEVLGKGSFGKVYHGIVALDGSDVAIKELKLLNNKNYQKNYDQIKEEIFILKTITNNNIQCSVSFIDLIHGKEDDNKTEYFFIVLSYYNGYSFDRFIKNNVHYTDEVRSNILKWFRDTRDCLSKLHKIYIYHRDIKPANIMLHDGESKIIDFGLAIRIGNDDPEPLRHVGTPKYFSKYYLQFLQTKSINIEEQRNILRFQDYWSLLITFYYVYTKNHVHSYRDSYSNPMTLEKQIDYIKHDRFENFVPDDSIPFISMISSIMNLIKIHDKPTDEMFEIIEKF